MNEEPRNTDTEFDILGKIRDIILERGAGNFIDAGFSRNEIIELFSGKQPRANQLWSLVQALGVTPEALLKSLPSSYPD